MIIQSYKAYQDFNGVETEQAKKTKKQRKTNFPKEQVRNPDLYKPVLENNNHTQIMCEM